MDENWGTFLSFALDDVWCTLNSNHPYRCWHLSQSINRCIGEVHTSLHKQPIKGITSILATQHSKDGPWVDGWKKTGTLPALALIVVWCTMSSNHPYRCWHPYQSINVFTCEVDTSLHKQTNNGITSIYPNNVLSLDGWKLGHFHPLPWLVCNLPWAPTIHTGVASSLNSSTGVYVRLIHYCTSKQTRELYSYWPYNAQRMYYGWMDENWGTFILCLGWCVVYHDLQPSMQGLTPLNPTTGA